MHNPIRLIKRDYRDWRQTELIGQDSFWWRHIRLWHYTRWLRYVWANIHWFVWMRITYWYCDHFGHKWEDNSHGGPESGQVGATCKRCGYSWHKTLY